MSFGRLFKYAEPVDLSILFDTMNREVLITLTLADTEHTRTVPKRQKRK